MVYLCILCNKETFLRKPGFCWHNWCSVNSKTQHNTLRFTDQRFDQAILNGIGWILSYYCDQFFSPYNYEIPERKRAAYKGPCYCNNKLHCNENISEDLRDYLTHTELHAVQDIDILVFVICNPNIHILQYVIHFNSLVFICIFSLHLKMEICFEKKTEAVLHKNV